MVCRITHAPHLYLIVDSFRFHIGREKRGQITRKLAGT